MVTRHTPAPPEEKGEEEQSSDDDNSSVAEVVKERWVGTKHNPAPPVKEEVDSDDNHSREPARYSNDDAFDNDGTSYHTAERSSSDDDDDILNNGNDDEAAVDDQDSTNSSNNYKMPSGGRDERAGVIQPVQSTRLQLLAEHQQVLPPQIWGLMAKRSTYAGCRDHSRLKIGKSMSLTVCAYLAN